jgi:hypothetical protein
MVGNRKKNEDAAAEDTKQQESRLFGFRAV